MMDAPNAKLTVQLPLVSLYVAVGSVSAKYASTDSRRYSDVEALVVQAATALVDAAIAGAALVDAMAGAFVSSARDV